MRPFQQPRLLLDDEVAIKIQIRGRHIAGLGPWPQARPGPARPGSFHTLFLALPSAGRLAVVGPTVTEAAAVGEAEKLQPRDTRAPFQQPQVFFWPRLWRPASGMSGDRRFYRREGELPGLSRRARDGHDRGPGLQDVVHFICCRDRPKGHFPRDWSQKID